MCGIAGVFRFGGARPDGALVERMRDTLSHRGPDDAGLFESPGVAFGFRRLSIIDLSGGHQPLFNEDGSLAVMLNGEIYGYRELRAELLARGHRLATSSDTETIVHLYEDHGLGFVDRLRGMFAIALHDAKRGRLVIARDRLGIKPLYVRQTPEGVAFGSELKALLADPATPREVDATAVL